MNKKDFSNLFADDYFDDREGFDPLRQASFQQEKLFITQYVSPTGNILDVGCSTGEFLKAINWEGKMYGVEISDFALQKAKLNGISFDKDISLEEEFFDVIVFRGTIQHLSQPFLFLEHAYRSLKVGGHVFFLATPNINCLYYKIWNDLPCLDKDKIFYSPSDKSLKDVMHIFNFEFVSIEYPYLSSPYSKPIRDHFKFLLKFFDLGQKFPFWKNMMNVCFIKK